MKKFKEVTKEDIVNFYMNNTLDYMIKVGEKFNEEQPELFKIFESKTEILGAMQLLYHLLEPNE